MEREVERDRSQTSLPLIVALALGAITGFLAARGGSAEAQVVTQDWQECFVMPIATNPSPVVGTPEVASEIPNGWSIVGTLSPAGIVLCR